MSAICSFDAKRSRIVLFLIATYAWENPILAREIIQIEARIAHTARERSTARYLLQRLEIEFGPEVESEGQEIRDSFAEDHFWTPLLISNLPTGYDELPP